MCHLKDSMSSSKKFMINTQYFNPATNHPYITNSQELQMRYNLKSGEPIPLDAKVKFLKTDEVILFMFENVECEPEPFIVYGNIINDIQKAIKESKDYIELTKQEAIDFQNIFKKSKLKKSEHNPLSLFIIRAFDKFIQDFEKPEINKPNPTPEIKN